MRLNELLKEYRMGGSKNDEGGVNRLMGLLNLIQENLNEQSVVCELGSYDGKSSELFALFCKQIYCIDIFIDYDFRNHEKTFDEMMKNYTNIVKIKDFSYNTYDKFENEFFDFVYIDTDHDYISVKNEIDNWFPKVKKNGYIGGHDYNLNGVSSAVIDFFKITPKVYDDFSWIIKK
jgi:hypothetical protein